jgi:transcriptional regulator with XRE-family HTH domain
MKKENLFKSRLKEERTRLGLKQTDLSEKIGITPRAVSGFETGEYGPNMNTFESLGMAGFDINYLVLGVRISSEQLQEIRKKLGNEMSREEIVSEIHYLVDKL